MTPGHAPRTKWQQPFDAALTDVFQVQADIAGQVAQALDVALGDSAQTRRCATQPTANLAAYDAYLKGEAASQGDGHRAIRRVCGGRSRFYEQAVALDSTFALAWAQLARAHAAALLQRHAEPDERPTRARRAAERAEALAPDRPEGQLALGDYYRSVRDGQPPGARGVRGRAQAGARTTPTCCGAAALAEQSLGRWEAALQHLEQAWTLDPRSVDHCRGVVGTPCSGCAAIPRRRPPRPRPRARARQPRPASRTRPWCSWPRATSPAPGP